MNERGRDELLQSIAKTLQKHRTMLCPRRKAGRAGLCAG